MEDASLLQEVIESHGGDGRWSKVNSIALQASAIFPLMMIKGVLPRWRNVSVMIDACSPRVVFHDYPRVGCRGEFDVWQARIQLEDGSRRSHTFESINGDGKPRYRYRWDELDLLFFMGYALWHYHVTPFVFSESGFTASVVEPVKWRGQWLRRLDITYPDSIPKHCKTQRYFIDDNGMIVRFDYTADVIGSWAKGAHLCSGHQSFAGITYPTRRKVLGGWLPSMIPPFPPAVIARIEDVEPSEARFGF